MPKRKSDFDLPTLDDLFSTQEERDEAKLDKIRDIPLELIDAFPDHPFHVRDDEDMQQLVDSIKSRGVLTPAVLREKEDGRYELVSGHRRKRACELAGLSTLRSEIKDLTRDEAISFNEFIHNFRDLGCPNFESVRRTRQMIQSQYPELVCSPKARRARSRGQKAYEKYAKEAAENGEG